MSALDQVLSIPSIKAEHPNLHADATDEIATLRAQLAEAREGLAEANVIMQFAKHDNMKFYREWVDKYYKHLVTTA